MGSEYTLVASEPTGAVAPQQFYKALIRDSADSQFSPVRMTITAGCIRELNALPAGCEAHILRIERDGEMVVDVVYERGAPPQSAAPSVVTSESGTRRDARRRTAGLARVAETIGRAVRQLWVW